MTREEERAKTRIIIVSYISRERKEKSGKEKKTAYLFTLLKKDNRRFLIHLSVG